MGADDFGNQVEEGFDRSAAVTHESNHFRQLDEAVICQFGKATIAPICLSRREQQDAIPLPVCVLILASWCRLRMRIALV